MPDLSAARSPPLVIASAWVEPLPPAARYVLRGGETVRAASGAGFGVEAPARPCRASAAGARAALWLGPDEWLLIARVEDGAAAAAALEASLKDLPHALTDVSHRQTALRVRGSQAAALLAAGCPLDLDEHAFPVGMCTRTVLAKAEVILWRTASSFRVEVARSFAAYVSQFLAEAARGLT
jgi:sarcosine oxidase, subunit gamma